ncbi:MAG: nuclear transport factor 2 family protein [Curvibacter sp.]|nr:MAG: nuclear transport factor 2 family protein [Curvibacter sp.]
MSTTQQTNTEGQRGAVQRMVDFFEHITPETVAELPKIYAPGARFKDPFNDVIGLPDIQRIFSHMFVALDHPRFVVLERVVQGSQCFLTWEFRFRFKRFSPHTEQVILGATHAVFNDAGLVTLHRDYWDAAEELYEKLPLVGGAMRWLKKRANS